MAEAQQVLDDDDDVEARLGISVEIVAVLGASDMKISQLLKMGRGAVVQLNRKVGDEIEVYANKQLIARGEVVVVEDKLGVNLTKIYKSNISRKKQP
ncbi:MAG: FliM/FliN family flagellar motor switch protein [Rhodospirillales bacterium]